ncbi:CMT1A duplicated region transcript 1 protein [Hypomesus transpacificus]|uniref:CMT1A duplicated region transcript 1 protein n=1 Tax=Hypomesus transpacificus TaxID=137520 RepID=UPI001F0863C2|nr:CMT1A duplicated region transcript 1 protein [Hypomesus transpacificus]
MKHFEYQQCMLQIDSAKEVCCKVNDEDFHICGTCQSCIFTSKLSDSTHWLWRAGDSSKRRFLTGILMRCHSVDILENVQNVLQVTFGKDFTYSRSKPKPSLPKDMTTWSSDRALDTKVLGAEMLDTWDWFSRSHHWIKCNYLLGILSLCDTDLLHMLGNLTSVLLVREKRSFLQFNAQDDEPEDEASSIAESSHTFNSLDHPDLELLVRTSSFYDPIDHDTDLSTLTAGLKVSHTSELSKNRQLTSVTPGTLSSLGRMFTKEEQCEASDTDSDDPALTVVPRSSKSLSGVSRNRDFIRGLPVHIAKYILGLLDKTSLGICRDVSRHWRYLTEGTQEDINAIRTKQNQAMMMQGSTHSGPSPVYAKIQEILVPLRDDEKHMHPVDCFSKVRKDRSFEAVYADVRTKVLEMEERNVFCGEYNVAVLLDRLDSSRVADYSGGQLVATGSKDRSVRLLDLVSQREVSPVIQGHAGSIRALLLCERRGLLISGSYDLSIRCWNLKTGACLVYLSGHSGTINCLDLHGNRLVSGAKDCHVKVWNLQTGTCYNKLKFKHNSPVLCVKLNEAFVLSSCEKGLVKMWDLETASEVKVIDAHQSSVKCLFFDSWHILSGGLDGQVMAWSTNRDMDRCLMTYCHPKEVLTLTLLYLRVITGCVDGKIRIFNFLSGECLRVIRAGGQKSPVQSLHIHNDNIVVNTHSSVMLYQFAKIDWDYKLCAEKDELAVNTGSTRSILRNVPYPSVRAERMAHVGTANRKIFDREGTTSEKPALSHHARFLSAPSMRRAQAAQQESLRPASWSELQGARRSMTFIDLQREFISQPPSALAPGRPVSGYSRDPQSRAGHKARTAPSSSSARESFVTTRWVMTQSEKAVLERVKKRGPHRPLTSDNILLRLNSARKPTDQAAVNMELNARVRDAWGSPPPPPSPPSPQHKDPHPPKKKPHPSPPQAFQGMTKTHVPLITTPLDLKTRFSVHRPDVRSSLPSATLVRPQTGLGPGEPPPQHRRPQSSPSLGKAARRVGAFTTTALEDSAAPQHMFMTTKCARPGHRVDFQMPGKTTPAHRALDPFRERGGFSLHTDSQLEEVLRAQAQSQERDQGSSARKQERQRKRMLRMKRKGHPMTDYTKENQVYAPELGPDAYI